MHDTKKILKVDPVNPEPAIIKRAVKSIKDNKIVVFPAQCIYGLAVNALNEQALKKVFKFKKRSFDKPVLILISNKKMLKNFVRFIPKTAQKLIKAFWPGDLTLVFDAKKKTSKVLTANTGKIGIRLAEHPVAKAIVQGLDFPITGTSANLSGERSCTNISKISSSIIKKADIILDAGKLKGGRSSVVDVSTKEIKMIRKGRITIDMIYKAL